MSFVFGRQEKSLEFVQAESRSEEVSPFFGLEVLRAFYSPGMLYKAVALHLQMISDRVDLDTPKKILNSCF